MNIIGVLRSRWDILYYGILYIYIRYYIAIVTNYEGYIPHNKKRANNAKEFGKPIIINRNGIYFFTSP